MSAIFCRSLPAFALLEITDVPRYAVSLQSYVSVVIRILIDVHVVGIALRGNPALFAFNAT